MGLRRIFLSLLLRGGLSAFFSFLTTKRITDLERTGVFAPHKSSSDSKRIEQHRVEEQVNDWRGTSAFDLGALESILDCKMVVASSVMVSSLRRSLVGVGALRAAGGSAVASTSGRD